jgi:diketogulonate reductase-like aldo/keto reductase
LEEGYRFFDMAPFYENEAEVGGILAKCAVPREELFVCSKLESPFHRYDDALKAFDNSLKLTGLDYLDLYLIHFPAPAQNLYCEAWRALEKLYKDGRVRAIGVSNFFEHHLQKVLDVCEIKPMVNELEINPYLTKEADRAFCRKQGVQVVNWFPLGGPRVGLVPYPVENFKVLLEDKVLEEIGGRYNKTTAQIALRWAVDSGIVPIPKASSRERIHENRDIFDFSLTAEELKRLDALNHDRRLGPDPNEYNEI